MKYGSKFEIVEKSVAQDRNFLYTIVSYSFILAIFLNLNTFRSPVIGLVASVIFSAVNAIFLGNAFFEKESTFFRLFLGVLVFIMLLGFIGWLIMMIYNLDVPKFTLVLLIANTLSSLLNRRFKRKNDT